MDRTPEYHPIDRSLTPTSPVPPTPIAPPSQPLKPPPERFKTSTPADLSCCSSDSSLPVPLNLADLSSLYGSTSTSRESRPVIFFRKRVRVILSFNSKSF